MNVEAEFQRAVGTDPEKWAEAFIQSALWLQSFRGIVQAAGGPEGNQQAVVAGWFRDAMEAAVKAAEPPSVDWDKLRDKLNVTLNEHGLPGLRKPSD